MPQVQLYTNLNKSKFDNAFAQSFIAAVAASIGAPKEAVVRQGLFENAGFPFLFASREDPNTTAGPRAAVPPWPARPVIERLA